MASEDPQWSDLRATWTTYRDAVDAWLEIASDPGREPAAVDHLIHELIAGHNAWSDQLGATLRATHHH